MDYVSEMERARDVIRQERDLTWDAFSSYFRTTLTGKRCKSLLGCIFIRLTSYFVPNGEINRLVHI